MKTRWQFLATALMTASLLIPAARAQEQAQGEQPTEGAARVSVIEGDVATQRGDSGENVATTVNAPVMRGDKVSTGPHSRTEVQLDYANTLRLDQNSEATVADLTRSRIQIQLAKGVMNFSVFKGGEAEVEIDTPNMAVHPLQAGSYRVEVLSPDQTLVTVREGQAEVTVPQGSTTVDKGQLITVQGTDSPQYQIANAQPTDEWDEWNRKRDETILSAGSWKHTNRYYTGTEDLDRHGHWTQIPDYGDVWAPDEGHDWAPYRDGRWVWEPYYGWTWVSNEPWGWAPYHYGRWIDWDDDWYWWPGYVTPFYYPVWSPAWVSFFGFGWGHFGFGFGFGSIGWCPLGPFDPFFPWWGFGNRFSVVNVTNITNITNINNVTNLTNGRFQGGRRVMGSNLGRIMTDPHVRNGITRVSTGDFVGGRIPRHPSPVTAASLRGGHVINGTVPAVPTRASLQPTGRSVSRGAIPRGSQPNHFFSTHTPPAGPKPFGARANEIQQMTKTQTTLQPMSGSRQVSAGRSATSGKPGMGFPTPGQLKPENPRASQGTQSGWQGFGQANSSAARRGAAPASSAIPRAGSQQAAPRAPAAPAGSGWRHFSPSQGGRTSGAPARPAAGGRETPNRGNSIQPRTAPSAPQPRTGGQGGWQRFSPRTAAPQIHVQGGERAFQPRSAPSAPQPRSEGQGGWQRFSPRSAPSSSGRWGAPSGGGYSREPLQIRKPIVSEGGGSGGGYRSGPSGSYRSAPSGSYRSAPSGSYGGGRSSGGWGGGSRSSGGGGGGGHSSGGGGWGGGGHSSGGGGGGHSSSGSSSGSGHHNR